MSNRNTLIEAFLTRENWQHAARTPLAGDASSRRYIRLRSDTARAIVMDAPPECGEDVRPFLHIARHLSSIGLSPPQILAADEDNGLLLLEDLGDDLYSTVVAKDPEEERSLYLAATDALIQLHHNAPPANAPDYGPAEMIDKAGLASDWYAFGATDQKSDTAKANLQGALSNAIEALGPWTPVLALRDYHAENLLWLPSRSGTARVGLLDFQDAGLSHPAYDLVSLAFDVRRKVSPETAAAMIAGYAFAQGLDLPAFNQACATISAQRNLRILGVFARLSMHYGKAHYVDLIPQVWSNLEADLGHPELRPLAQAVAQTLPTPEPALLQKIKDKCATIPLPS